MPADQYSEGIQTSSKPLPAWKVRAWSLCFGTAISVGLIAFLYQHRQRADEVALQGRAVYVDGVRDGKPLNSGTVDQLKQRFPQSDADIWWFSNSHGIAVLDRKPDDQGASSVVSGRLGEPIYQAALPLLNYSEELTLCSWMLSQPGHPRPRIIVLQLPIYALRLDGLRDDLIALRTPDALRELETTTFGKALAPTYLKLGLTTQGEIGGIAGGRASLQERVEKTLQAKADALPAWKARTDMMAGVMVGTLKARNTVFRVDLAYQRKFIPATVGKNIEAISSIVEMARARGSKVLAYFVPVNPEAALPYSPQDYAELKARLTAWARDNNVVLADFDSIVPAECFVRRGEGIEDFTHFNAKGHAIFGAALADKIREVEALPGAASTTSPTLTP